MTKTKFDIAKINAIAEFDRLGLKWEPKGSNEVALLCPKHQDTNPSCFFNTEKNLWKCHSCNATGDIVAFIAIILNSERGTVLADLSKRYDIEVKKSVPVELIERYHQALISTESPLKKSLYDRCITDDLIRSARLGLHDGRITIPIYDIRGDVINIRKYLPGAIGPEKFRNLSGYDVLALYQPKHLIFDRVWLCGGEMKALVAGSILREIQVGAIAVTGGEGAWDTAFNRQVKGKSVYVAMDIDVKGKSAALKLAKQICTICKVFIVKIPLDSKAYPKGDINDWVKSGATLQDFIKAMQCAERYKLDDEIDEVEEPISTTLAKSLSPENIGRLVSVEAVVQAVDTVPYLVPKDIGVSCDKSQLNCSYCPVWPKDPDPDKGYVVLTVKGTARGVLDLINTGKKIQGETIRDALKIPPCKIASFSVLSHHKIYDTRIIPPISTTERNSEQIVQPAYIAADIELNTPYVVTGRTFPSPRNQQAVLIFDKVDQSRDNLASVMFSLDEVQALQIFQPEQWTVESITAKLTDIYEDFEANVTHIYKRRELHLALDLTWHSVLNFKFDGRVQNGWLNVLIVGDSSQGKSETSLRMMQHYNLGASHSCKVASIAGLIGGVQQLGTKNFITWGVIPTHDRRLVILEEFKGANYETIGALTDMRSSGVADITKIERRKSFARTRIAAISNPRSDRPVSAFNFGCEAIKELVGAPEDIRRFDLAVIVASSQVNISELNKLICDRPQKPERYTSELCHLGVLWAWTRSNVRIEKDAETACLTHAMEMCNTFTELLPLCDRGTMRYKIARLAAALAARTFSHDGETLLVRKCHVDYIAQWVRSLYADPVFGYGDFSRAQHYSERVIDKPVVEKYLRGTKHPKDLVENLLNADEISVLDIADWAEVDGDLARQMISFMVRKHTLYRSKMNYIKTSEFITLLKSMREAGISNVGESSPEDEI